MNLSVLEPKIGLNAPKSLSLEYVLNGISDFENKKPSLFKVNYRPKYQRNEAWNKDFKDTLLYSVITNYPIGTFIFRILKENDEATHEVVDGQQRLLALKEIIFNKNYLIGAEISKKIISENLDCFKSELELKRNKRTIKVLDKYTKNPSSTIKLSFEDLPTVLKDRVLTYQLPIIEINKASDESVAQYFRYIQNQERLRAGELINSIPDSSLFRFQEKINDKDKFLKNLNWNESRKEFDKIFYSMIGIFDKKLNFGTTDEMIINYVAKTESISKEAEEMTLRMVGTINLLTELAVTSNVRFTKRLLKFLFLSSGYGVVDYKDNPEKKFKTLFKIESKLPFFNSATDEDIKNKFKDYPDNIVRCYRHMFLFGRGSHSPRSVEIEIRNLGLIVSYEMDKNS